MSRIIRVDSEVYRITVDIQAKLMIAAGHHVTMSDAIKFILNLRIREQL